MSSTTDKLKRLNELSLCSCSVCINEYRTVHKSADEFLDEQLYLGNLREEHCEFLGKMRETGNIVEVRSYNISPVGFYEVLSHDLDIALDKMLEILEAENGKHDKE